MSKSFKVDLTGQRFGRLTVLEFVPNEKRQSFWLCQCDCGNIHKVNGEGLKNGKIMSCGCIRKEQIRKRNTKHGFCKNRVYSIWKDIKKRCLNPNYKQYMDYGGRGITICCEWKDDFVAFRNWAMSHGYTDDLSIDRIDVNGNYEPSNCRWVNINVQAQNKRNNLIIEYKGNKICLAEASRCSGVSPNTLSRRYKKGERGEELFRPVKTK